MEKYKVKLPYCIIVNEIGDTEDLIDFDKPIADGTIITLNQQLIKQGSDDYNKIEQFIIDLIEDKKNK